MSSKSAGKLLFAFLQTEWDAMGIGPTAWARRVGLPDATVLRWRDEDVDPDMRTLRRVAEALERPVVDVLLAAGYVTSDELNGYAVPVRTYDIIETIRLDQKLSDPEREALRQVHDAFALVQSGQAKKVRVRRKASA